MKHNKPGGNYCDNEYDRMCILITALLLKQRLKARHVPGFSERQLVNRAERTVGRIRGDADAGNTSSLGEWTAWE